MNGTIICAVDGSEGVAAAVQVARRLAERFDARIVLVRVAHGVRAGPADARATGSRAEEYRLAAGDPAEAVAVIATEEKADLIVVGVPRRRLGRATGTEFARDLAATAPCPVVLVPPEAAAPVERRAPLAPALG